MGNTSSSDSSSSYGMVVREAESPFAPPRGVFRRKGDDGAVHLVSSTDGVAGETRRSVSRYDVTLATPSIGGQPGTFTRTGSFLIHPHLLRKYDEERAKRSVNGDDVGGRRSPTSFFTGYYVDRRGSPDSSSANSFFSPSSIGAAHLDDENSSTSDSMNNNNNANIEKVAGCPRCNQRRTQTLSSSSHSRNPKRRRDSSENASSERRLIARDALFDSCTTSCRGSRGSGGQILFSINKHNLSFQMTYFFITQLRLKIVLIRC